MFPPVITVNLQDLQNAFEAWERDCRAGLCMSQEELSQLSVEDVAKSSAQAFWRRLTQNNPCAATEAP